VTTRRDEDPATGRPDDYRWKDGEGGEGGEAPHPLPPAPGATRAERRRAQEAAEAAAGRPFTDAFTESPSGTNWPRPTTLDGASPPPGPTGSSRPSTDADRPGTDGDRPGTDAGRRGTDGGRRGTDGGRRGTPADRPGTDGDRPGTDAGRGGTDGGRRGTAADRPGTDGDRLGTDGGRRGTAADRPGTDGDRLGTDGGRRGTAADRLGTEGGRLGSDGGRLGGDGDGPRTDPYGVRVDGYGSDAGGGRRSGAGAAGGGLVPRPRDGHEPYAGGPRSGEPDPRLIGMGFDPGDTGTWRVRDVVPGADGGRRTTVILRYLLGLLAVDHVRSLTKWAFALPLVGLVLLVVRPRWIGSAVIVLGVLLIVGRFVAVRMISRRTLPRRYRPVEDELRAAVEAGKANLRGELDRVGMPSSALALTRSVVRLGSSDSRSRLRDIEIDRVLPRAQLDRALRVLDEAPAPR
jgi:hypothetical protein